MEEAPEQQLHVSSMSLDGPKEQTDGSNPQPAINQQRSYSFWLRVAILAIFVLAGQSAATLLGRLYFDKGGNSKWMATLVQPGGFLILLPCYLFFPPKNSTTASNGSDSKPPLSNLVLASLYFTFGIFIAADCLLYSLGLLYLPVSTYSLICASQLAFNAFFSFFLNSQKLTPVIVNSLVLLTISSVLLVFHTDDSTESSHASKRKYVLGFIFTISASAGYGLMLSFTQFCFKKVLKQATLKVVLDMIVYPSLVSTCAVLIGLFASGEWKGLSREMKNFELGKVSYLMTLIWAAISWQVFTIGCVGLIFEVSSLFSNVISTVGLPIVPVLAVPIFKDRMDGVKVVSMVLAIWGFVSYAYQHYLDGQESRTRNGDVYEEVSDISSSMNPKKKIFM